MSIRKATPTDIPTLIELCAAHAEFEQASYNPEGKAEALAQELFEKESALQCIVAEVEGEVVGYAAYIKQFSTWDVDHYVYLDCLYLKEHVRGQGLGHKLMDEVKRYAATENCKEVQWHTPEFNAKAIQFYTKIGATSKTKVRFFWPV